MRHRTRTDPTRPLTCPGAARAVRRSFGRLRADHHRSPPDRHPAGIGLLQLPRRVGSRLTSDPAGYSAADPITGTYNYAAGHRPARYPGLHPRPEAGSPGVGYGSNPFIDIGAYQYVNLHPPEVTASPRRRPRARRPVNFYTVGGISGVNTDARGRSTSPSTARSIPSTINANTVELVDLGSNPAPAARRRHQPRRQALVRQLDRHPDHQPGGRRPDAGHRRLPDHPLRQRLAGDHQPAGRGPGRREHGRRHLDRRAARPALGQRLPGRQLLRLVHHQHHAARRSCAGSLKLDPASDTNIVGDDITSSTLADLRRHGQRAQPAPGARRRPDGDPRHRHRGAGQRRVDDLLRRQPAPGSLSEPGPVHPPGRGHRRSPTTGGAFPVTVGVDAANTGLVTNTNPLPDLFGDLQRRGQRRSVACCPAPTAATTWPGSGSSTRAATSPIPTDPNAQVPFVVDTTPPTLTFTAPTADQVITSLNRTARSSSRSSTNKNIDHDPLHGGVDPGRSTPAPTASWARPTTSRSRSTPTRSRSRCSTQGIGGNGAEQITFSTEGTADQQPLSRSRC